MTSAIAALPTLGQSAWYDNLTREVATTGLARLVAEHGITGVTSNPTIFEKAITGGGAYDADLADGARSGRAAEAVYWDLVCADIAAAADRLRATYESTGGADGYVSVEVSPDLADNTAATVAQAEELHARIGRPNVMIKIPATLAGLPAVTDVIAAGIPVNVTLIFAVSRYRAVIDAYMTGLERRLDADTSAALPRSVASFFVSRVDTEVDRRLGPESPLRGRAAVANAKLAYRTFGEAIASPRWTALADRGAHRQRPLWASTSTKNPEYPTDLYVAPLIGPDTVNTLADASIDALAGPDVRLRGGTVLEGVDEAERDLAAIAAAGVDLDDVTALLEVEGVAAFRASYHEAIATVARRMAELSRR